MMRPKKEPESITLSYELIRRGDNAAVEQIWTRFFDRLVSVARREMQNANRRVADEEDVASVVLASLCSQAEKGHLPHIHDRDDLWRMLLVRLRNEVVDHVRSDKRAKRGAGKVRGDSVWEQSSGLDGLDGLEPTPQLLLELNEELQLLLSKLPNAAMRTLANLKMQGFSNLEIAGQLGVSERTIERKLAIIRECWKSEDSST